MSEITMVTTYMGKDIHTLTREELIEALESADDMEKTFNFKGREYWTKLVHVPKEGRRLIGGTRQYSIFVDQYGFFHAEPSRSTQP